LQDEAGALLAPDISNVAILIGSLLVILLSCEIFVNGIEWLGRRLGISECATGSILAAVGTAMPETIIPIIAIFLGSAEEGEKIGEGAILGAPFMLSTLAMFVGGLTVMVGFRQKRRSDRLVVDSDHVERDLEFFMVMYALALLAGMFGFWGVFDHRYFNYALAAVLLVAYGFYLLRTWKAEVVEAKKECAPMYLSRLFGLPVDKGRLGFAMILLQVASSLIGIIIGAKFFVEEVEHVSASVGIPPMILAFLIAPVATELPEKFNSIIWYWRGRDTLALGNITGAMVFQSSFPVSVGLLFTAWMLEPINIASIIIALTAAGWILYSVKRHKSITYRTMLASGSLYATYIAMLLVFGTS
jgi:cation:H+ antiporter